MDFRSLNFWRAAARLQVWGPQGVGGCVERPVFSPSATPAAHLNRAERVPELILAAAIPLRGSLDEACCPQR